MDYPKISIITVSYNGKDFIEKTIKSVLSQKYSNFEYIIIDGGSTDGTLDIIRKYSKHLAFWISEPDGGIYDAMNKGLEHVSGEWVNFMNVGDEFVNDRTLVNVFSRELPSDVKVVYGNTLNDFGSYTNVHKAEDAAVLRDRLAFSHQASFVSTGFYWRFNLEYKIAADYDLFYSVFDKFGEKAFFNTGVEIAKYKADDGFSLANTGSMSSEYIKIRARKKNLRWYKDFFKLMLNQK